jgi:hypothetical protein
VYFWFLLRQDPEINPSLIVRALERRRDRLTREVQQRFQNIIFITSLKVHKNENFFGFDFEICTFS